MPVNTVQQTQHTCTTTTKRKLNEDYPPVEALVEKNGNVCALILSTVVSTLITPALSVFNHFWNPYAISLTVTGICTSANLTFASVTSSASCDGVRTESKRGSEPNWRTRVMKRALGLEWRVEIRLSRRVFHWSVLSKPNWEVS